MESTATVIDTVIATATVIDTSTANAGASAGEENASGAANEETACVFYIDITYLKPKISTKGVFDCKLELLAW